MDDDARLEAIRQRADIALYALEHSASCDAWSDMNGSDCTCSLDNLREDIPWLLDRLRTAEANLETVAKQRTEWAGRASIAEARAAEAEAVIAEAPHPDDCEISPWGNVCTCWKSRYRAGADHE